MEYMKSVSQNCNDTKYLQKININLFLRYTKTIEHIIQVIEKAMCCKCNLKINKMETNYDKELMEFLRLNSEF